MAVQINQPGMSLTAGAALVARRLVKSDGTYCGVGTTRDWVGVVQEDRANGAQTPIRFVHAGTCILTASVAITAGDVVYKAANGKIGKTTTSNTRVGIALESASGDDIQIAVLCD